MNSRLLGCLAALFFTLGVDYHQTAHAGTLQEAISSMAKSISSYLDEKGQRQIMMGNFDGPGTATAGRAIRNALKDELTKENTEIVPLNASWTVRGQFSFERDGTFAIVLLKADLFDKSGKEISGFRQKVKVEQVSSIEDISRLLGLTVDLNKEQEAVAATADVKATSAKDALQLTSTNTKLADKVVTSVNEPTFAYRNEAKTEISPDATSKFRVSVLVKPSGSTSYQALPIQDTGGFPFAPLQANDSYRIKIDSDAEHSVGVKVSIDGINSFALSEDPAYRELGTWFFSPDASGTVSGWYINPGLLKEFLVTSRGDSLGLPDASDIGTVTIQFFHAWREGEQPPAVELLASKRGQLRTGVGNDIQRKAGFQKCEFGEKLLASISIRYSNPDDLPPPQ